MSSRLSPPLVIGAVLVLFVAVGGFLVFRSQGGGGAPVTWNVTVTNGSTMTPDHLTARAGDTVTINIRSDRAGEVHLHGYDIAFETQPGQVASRTFGATRTGDFDIEWESTSTHLGDLAVSP